MGRHAAGGDAGVHPIVAAALRERAPEVLGGGRSGPEDGATAQDEGAVGWPAPPPDGSGLGWPDDTVAAGPEAGRAAPQNGGPALPHRGGTVPGAQPGPRRPGWWRWPGRPAGSPGRVPQGTSVA